MRLSRLIGFVIAILVGVAGGLTLGWLNFPGDPAATRLEDLRDDYKADYVLMVAEVYATDGSIENALTQLIRINPDNPLRAVQQGLLTAQQMGFEDWEMRYMADLEMAIRNQLVPETVQ